MSDEVPAPKFKPGDMVQFPGLRVKGLNIKPVSGMLYLSEKNKKPGVMMIRGDKQKMMFYGDGTIYCHPQYGCMLKMKEDTNVAPTQANPSAPTVPTVPNLTKLITGQPSISISVPKETPPPKTKT